MELKDGIDYIPQIKELIMEYTKWLNRDLTFQNLEEELSNPAKKYTSPAGEVLVAIDNDKVLGMVAYHRHNEYRCEMKRLYVKPEARGLQVGDLLVQQIIQHARIAGFKEMVLDTLLPMKEAINLYKKYGFEECDAYYNNPMEDVVYLKKEL